MGYTSRDFFYEHIAPKMAELFKNYDPDNEGAIYEGFKEILSLSLLHENSPEKFQGDLVRLAVDPEGTLTVEKAVEVFFNIFLLYEEMEIKKLEYASGGAVIKVEYGAAYEEGEK